MFQATVSPEPRQSARKMSGVSFESHSTSTILTRTSNRSRYLKLVELVVTALVPIVTLFVVVGIELSETFDTATDMDTMKTSVATSLDVGGLIGEIQMERGLSSMYVSTEDGYRDDGPLDRLMSQRNVTDAAVADLDPWPGCAALGEGYDDRASFESFLEDLRASVIADPDSVVLTEMLQNYTDIDHDFMLCIWAGGNSDLESILVPEHFFSHLQALVYIIWLSDAVGLQRALGSAYFLKCGLDRDVYIWYTELEGVTEYLIDVVKTVQSEFYSEFRAEIDAMYPLEDVLDEMTDEILTNWSACRYDSEDRVDRSGYWFGNMTTYVDIILELRTNITAHISDDIVNMMEEVSTDVMWNCVIAAVSFFVYGFLVVVYMYRTWSLLQTVQVCVISINRRTESLRIEKKRTDYLLAQLFPASILTKLKGNEPIPAEWYDNVTIYFSDIVKFTVICGSRTPFQVVDILNYLYILMDDLIDSYQVHKVETIGDAYMVVSGAPDRTEKHASEIAWMALALRDAVKTCSVPHMGKGELNIRIGIHSGPVAAGMAGNKMPKFSLFGDTVNTASRMESSGQANMIHISQTTKDCLDEVGTFNISVRGVIPVKGKGMMDTYWLDETTGDNKRKKSICPIRIKTFRVLFDETEPAAND